jgi:hypothetical protein
VASELNWGLADCESLSVEADKQTLTAEDFAKVIKLLKFRPMHLKVLLGAEEMQPMMIEAIGCETGMEWCRLPDRNEIAFNYGTVASESSPPSEHRAGAILVAFLIRR